MNKERRKYIESCQVSVVKEYSLKGYEQKVLIEGKSKAAPIVIYLHGGPGSPLPFCAGGRGLFPEITERFILVTWDQLGCGINDYRIDDTFTIEDFVQMTLDLIEAVHRDFPDNEINLFGVSWGSILAARAAAQMPERIHSVVTYGQITKELFFNPEVYHALDLANLGGKAKEQLAQMKEKPEKDVEDVRIMAGLIKKYTEGYQAKDGVRLPIGKIFWGLLTSPDYSFRNCKALMVNGTMKNRSLYEELLRLDLTGILEKISVPYYILQGATDIVTSKKYVKNLVEMSKNPNLHMYEVPDSGHIPGGRGMEFIMDKGFGFFTILH